MLGKVWSEWLAVSDDFVAFDVRSPRHALLAVNVWLNPEGLNPVGLLEEGDQIRAEDAEQLLL